MSQRVSTPVLLAHVIFGMFCSTPVCLGFNPNYLFRFEKYNQNFDHSLEVHDSKPMDYDKSSESNINLHSEIVKTIIPNITRNVSYSREKYSAGKHHIYPMSPENAVHRLPLKIRSGYGTVTVNRHLRKSSSARLASRISPPEGLLDYIRSSHKSDTRNDSFSGLRFPRKVSDSLSIGNGTAYSKSDSRKGNAKSRSYATGLGSSKAETNARNGGNATAQAKALEGNSSATATSTGGVGGHALAAAESGGFGNATSTSISQGNGSSKSVAIVIEGNALATGIHDTSTNDTNDNSLYGYAHNSSSLVINFDDPFFRPGYKFTTPPTGVETTPIQLIRDNNVTEFEVTHSTTEAEAKLRAFPMGRTLNGEFEISEEQSTPENGVKPMGFQMGRTLNGEFDISEEQSSTKPIDFGTRPSKTTPPTKTTLKPQTNPTSANKNDIEPSTTENQVKPMAFQRGRTLNGEFEISEEQTTTEHEVKPMVFQRGRTLNGEFEISEEHTTHEAEAKPMAFQRGRTLNGEFEISEEQTTTEHEAKPMAFPRGRTLNGEFEISEEQTTTEHEAKPMAFQRGRTLNGEFEISEEQITTEHEVKPMVIQRGRTLNGEFEISEEQSTTDSQVKQFAFPMGRTLNGEFEISEEHTTHEAEAKPMAFPMGRTLNGEFEISEEQPKLNQVKGRILPKPSNYDSCNYKTHCDKVVCCNHYVINLMARNISSWLI